MAVHDFRDSWEWEAFYGRCAGCYARLVRNAASVGSDDATRAAVTDGITVVSQQRTIGTGAQS